MRKLLKWVVRVLLALLIIWLLLWLHQQTIPVECRVEWEQMSELCKRIVAA